MAMTTYIYLVRNETLGDPQNIMYMESNFCSGTKHYV